LIAVIAFLIGSFCNAGVRYTLLFAVLSMTAEEEEEPG
jgi:hypothetical protein